MAKDIRCRRRLDKTRSHSNVDQRSSWFCLSLTLFKFNYELVVVCLLFCNRSFLSLETCPVLDFLSLDFVSRVNVNRFFFLSSPRFLSVFPVRCIRVVGRFNATCPQTIEHSSTALGSKSFSSPDYLTEAILPFPSLSYLSVSPVC